MKFLINLKKLFGIKVSEHDPDSLRKKIMLQILSVGFAIVLWFMVSYAENPDISITLNNIPISYTGTDTLADKGLIAVYDDKPTTVSAVLRGTRNDLFNVARNISATVDLSEVATVGNYDMPVNINLPLTSVELIRKKTPTLEVKIDPIITKDIPINITQLGSNKQYLIKSVPASEFISIQGAKSEVELIERANVYIDISDITQDTKSHYTISFSDNENNELEPVTVKGLSPIAVSNTIYKQKSVPIEIQYPDSVTEDYIITPSSTALEYISVGIAPDDYENVSSINAMFPENISEGSDAEITVYLPEQDNIYYPDGNTVTVRADIEKKQTAEITLPVTLLNTPSDLNVSSADLEITITAKGKSSLLNQSGFSASADLSGLSEGRHNVAVVIDTPESVSVKRTYYIDVTLTA